MLLFVVVVGVGVFGREESNHLVARSTFGGLGGTISVPGFNGTLSGFVCVRKIVHNGDDSTKHWNDEQLHFPQQ